jgi:stage III sporulation protein SpoIIIAA
VIIHGAFNNETVVSHRQNNKLEANSNDLLGVRPTLHSQTLAHLDYPQVRDPSMQHRVMIEAVENHMPEVVIVDEIGTEAEALACRSIAERGVQLVGTAHGQMLENLIKNPTLSDLVSRHFCQSQ